MAKGKQKNIVRETDISAGGNVDIGDKTTINVYGMQTNQKELEFWIKVYGILILLFGAATMFSLFFPEKNDWPTDYITFFASGGFFALVSLFLVVFLKSKNQHSISNIVTNAIQNDH